MRSSFRKIFVRNIQVLARRIWTLISRGEVENGMSKDMCRLAFGEPMLIHKKGNNKEFEDWIYKERVLSFTKGKLNNENQ